MSTATAPERSHAPYAEPDEYIDYQLRKTQTSIKRTDMLTAAVVAVTVMVGYVLLFVLSDHWLFDGGVGGTLRVLMFLPVMGFLGWLIGAKVIWPALKNVSGLFAAKTLETSSEEFRSSLLSLIDLQRANRPVAPAILATMEKRVAVTLTKLDVEDAIDKRPLLRTLYVLFGIVVAFCLYSVLSPKKLAPSVLRAIAPFTNVTPATQTEILEVKPGDAKLRAGGSLPISVRLRGEIPNKVLLLHTTSDRRFVDEPFELGQTTDPFQFEGTFGEDGQGLLQSFSYRVVAGDARSPDYQVTIITPPSATVTEVRFDYPEYMELDPRTQPGGAIDVWERTAVMIKATANVLVHRGDFELADTEDFANAYPGSTVKVENGKQLTIAWRADPRQSDSKFPKFYRVKVWDADGNPDPKPAIYPINVRLDLPPHVALIDPTADLKLPANGTVPLVVAARDQDFKLRTVSLKIARDTNDVLDETLFDGAQQEVALKHDFQLEPLRLKTGDRIKIWIEAQDNRLPTHNLAKTEPLTIEVADRVSKDEAKKQLDEQKQEQQKKLDQARENNNEEGAERPEQQPSDLKPNPPSDDSRDPMPRDKQEQRDPDQQDKDQPNQANKPNQADSKSNDKSSKGQTGSSGQPQKGSDKQPDSSKRDGQSGQQQSGKNGEASPNNKNEKPSLKSNGEDDDKALEKVLERRDDRQRGNAEKQKSQSEPGDDSQGNPAGQSQPNQSSKSKPGSDSPTNDPRRTDRDKPSADKTKKDSSGETSPMPRDDQGNSPKDPKNAEGSNNPKDDKKNNQAPGDSSKPGDKDKGANSDKPSPDKSASPDKSSTKPAGNSDKQDGGKDPAAGNDPAAEKKDGDGSSKSPMKQSDGDASKGKQDSTGKANDPAKKGQPGQPSNDSKASGDPSDKKQSDSEKPASDNNSSKSDNSQGDDTKSKQNASSPNGSDSQKDSNSQKSNKDGSQESPDDKQPSAQDKGSSSKKQGDPNPMDDKSSNAQKPDQSDKDQSSTKKSSKRGSADKRDSEKDDHNNRASNDKNNSGKKENSDDTNGSNKKSSDENTSGKKPDSSNDSDSQKSSDKNSGQSAKGNSKGSQDSPGKPGSQQSQQPSAGKQASGSPGQGSASNSAPQPQDKDGKPVRGQQGDHGEGNVDDASEEADPRFTKEATNLVLKRLKNELDRGEVDQEFLDEFGWTPEQMKKFVDRMQQQLDAPEDDHSPVAQAKRRQFEEMLRNLNLTSKTQRRDDTNQNKQSGDAVGPNRRPPPAEYKEWFESYTKSLSKKQAAEKK